MHKHSHAGTHTNTNREALMFRRDASSRHFRGGEGNEKKRERNSQRKISVAELNVASLTQQSGLKRDVCFISKVFPHALPTPVELFSLSPSTGDSINPRVAGLIGRSGPQSKQPFMVAFFKATEVHLRSIRSAPGGGKQRNPNRSKGAKSQEALRMANIAGEGGNCVCRIYSQR